MHGLRGSLACPDRVSAGLGIIRLLEPSDVYLLRLLLRINFDFEFGTCCLLLTSFSYTLPSPHYNLTFPILPLGIFAIMEQPSEPNNAAMRNVQARRGSVGTSQLFENIVSTSNCMFAAVVSGFTGLCGA